MNSLDTHDTPRLLTLLGAGGAAKAVAFRLAQAGAERVWVCNRTAERAEALFRQAADTLN